MTHDEMIKFAYETMIKNNPDEALKVLIMQDKKIKELINDNKELLKTYDDLEEQYKSLMKQVIEQDKRINKAIEYINVNQNEKTLCLNYHQLKKLRDILKGESNE